ncbi:glycosyltransferase family 4 protein [Terrimonas sp. NA20]|uniref:Glycosyltransferase family 4 protein n=1 Tax=Terrimonas ginsenosidimutans TaxID=2908004 RepID=A0ABS9L070_9BACT|nr:glycosyltransferase family 1 protein [Terrimonas ginsenosidimutans]MCG2617908.1 glycosyltransferase family 4 protein [Terrimonas ginsenosidimutans]
MNIAVNTRFLVSNTLEGYGYYLKEMLSRLVANHPEHQFIFIFDRPYSDEFIQAANITPVVAGPPARHPLLWKWWYDIRIPSVLKKYKADVFLSCDGFCSLSTSVPQCLVIHDLAFLHHPSFIYRSHLLFYKRYTPKFLKKASSVVTVSQFSKNDIIAHYKTDPDGIDVIYNAARSSVRPLSWQEKQSVTHEFTAGKNYFIYAGSIHPRKNLVNLLKAFSIFKKRQKSDWKLVIAGRAAWQSKKFMESLSSYKYRDDLVLTGYVDDQKLSQLTGAAYAMVYPSLFEGFGMPVAEAMQAGVPVITSENSAMQEIAGDSALYANPASHEDIADKMMRLYKDEVLRDRLIQKGLEKAKEYDWDRSAAMLWRSIEKAIAADRRRP